MIAATSKDEFVRHFLWRCWQKLSGSQEINVFDRSWYGRVLVELVENLCSEAEWRRAYDEINEFEAQQIDSGTNIVKLFVHTTQQEQDERLESRLSPTWKRWKTGTEDYRNRARREDSRAARDSMVRLASQTRAACEVVDGDGTK